MSDEAGRLVEEGRLTAALSVWREALELLPRETRQHGLIVARIAALRERVDAVGYVEPEGDRRPDHLASVTGASPERPRSEVEAAADPTVKGGTAGKRTDAFGFMALAGLAVWKFKFVFVAIASKLKLLLMGVSKGSTFFSMLVYLGPCWALWGWKFGVCIVLSIYVHEMGHVAALTRYGIKASAPMFIPGFGALVRLHQYPSDAIEDARIGLAGPLWGLGAALASCGAWLVTGNALFAAVAKFGAWINLFNLLPFWQLDGGRGFRAPPRHYRFIAVLWAALAGVVTHEGLLALIVVAGALRAFSADCPRAGGERALIEYLALIAGLSLLNAIPVPLP